MKFWTVSAILIGFDYFFVTSIPAHPKVWFENPNAVKIFSANTVGNFDYRFHSMFDITSAIWLHTGIQVDNKPSMFNAKKNTNREFRSISKMNWIHNWVHAQFDSYILWTVESNLGGIFACTCMMNVFKHMLMNVRTKPL